MPSVTSMTTGELLTIIESGQENDNYDAAVEELRFRYHESTDTQVVEQLRGGIRPGHGPTH